MRADHKAVFDRLGKALDREIAKCDIDLDPPRCQRQGWANPVGIGGIGSIGPVPAGHSFWDVQQKMLDALEKPLGIPPFGAGYFHVPVSPAALGQPIIYGDQSQAIDATILAASIDEVKKYGQGAVTVNGLKHAMKNLPPDILAALQPKPETKADKRRKRKGKG